MSTKVKTEPDVVSGKRFSDHIMELERGELDHDLTATLNEVVRKVRENSDKGAVKLTLHVKPCDRAALQVEITAVIDSKIPKAPRRKNLAFTTASGELRKEDPNQMQFQEGGFEDE